MFADICDACGEAFINGNPTRDTCQGCIAALEAVIERWEGIVDLFPMSVFAVGGGDYASIPGTRLA